MTTTKFLKTDHGTSPTFIPFVIQNHPHFKDFYNTCSWQSVVKLTIEQSLVTVMHCVTQAPSYSLNRTTKSRVQDKHTRSILTAETETNWATITLWIPTFIQLTFKIVASTSRKTHFNSITQANLLMRFRDCIAVYCENHAKHTSTLRGWKCRILMGKSSGIYTYHCALKD
jgi:hypothetical protein